MKVLVKDGKVIKLNGGAIKAPESSAELKPCEVTITSRDYLGTQYALFVYISQDGKLVFENAQAGFTFPKTIQTVQNSVLVMQPSGFSGIVSYRNSQNLDYRDYTSVLYCVPMAEKCSIDVYNSD